MGDQYSDLKNQMMQQRMNGAMQGAMHKQMALGGMPAQRHNYDLARVMKMGTPHEEVGEPSNHSETAEGEKPIEMLGMNMMSRLPKKPIYTRSAPIQITEPVDKRK